MKRNGLDLQALAAQGAPIRLAELAAEIRRIRRAFPTAPMPLDVALSRRKVMAKLTTPKRRLRKWSQAQRNAVAMRMKKYWAAKRRTG